MSKTDKFKDGINKLKNSKTFKILLLSSILLTSRNMHMDLIAQYYIKPSDFNSAIRNDGVKIINEDPSTRQHVEELSSILQNLKNENHLTNFIISEFINNGTHFEFFNNGAENDFFHQTATYEKGKNIVEIKRSELDNIDSTKQSIVHEGIHMLQDKTGILNDIFNLNPIDSSILYIITEVDANLKEEQALNPDMLLNERLKSFEFTEDVLNFYLESAIQINEQKMQLGGVMPPRTTLEEAVKKLNLQNWPENYSDTKNIINKVKNMIPEEYKEQLTELENQYNSILTSLNLNPNSRS